MPAERTVDQRLDALERRVAAPTRDEVRQNEAQHTECPPVGEGRTTGSTSGTVRDPAGDTTGVAYGAPEPTSSTGTGDADPGQSQRPSTDTSGESSGSTDTASTGHSTDIEGRLDAIEAELAELQARLQALRGYVANVDPVNESVERRANAALPAVERLEAAPRHHRR